MSAAPTHPTTAPPHPPHETWQTRAVRYGAYLVIGLLAFYWLMQKTAGLEVGTVAPDFDLPTTRGERFELAAQRGTPVVVEVVASWCDTCERSAPTLVRASQRPRAREVRFVAVSMDESMASTRDLQRRWGLPFPVLHDDGSFARQYKVNLLPTVIVIDADGTIARAKSGPPSAEELEAWLASMGAHRL